MKNSSKKAQLPTVTFEEDDGNTSGLFNELSGVPTQQQRVIELIQVDLIEPSPYQSRKIFDQKQIEQFADVMREEGFTSTIWVRPHPTKNCHYELLFGERRWRAASLVVQDSEPKFTAIPCEIRTDYTDPDRIRFLGFFENKERVNLTPSEEAIYYRDLLNLKGPDERPIYTYEKLAIRAKVPESHIQDCLYLLTIPEDVRTAYDLNPTIALRALREVCRIDSLEERKPLLDLLVTGSYSVQALRAVVLDLLQDEQQEGSTSKVNGQAGTPHSTSIEKSRARKQPEPLLQEATQETISSGDEQNSITREDTSERNRPGGSTVRAFKAVVRRDTKTLSDILKRWQDMARQENEVAEMIQTSAREVYELLKQFLPVEGE